MITIFRLPTPYQLTRFFHSKKQAVVRDRNLSWYFSLEGLRNQWRLEMLRNRHKGKRCFLLGNGPSLNKMDLRPLAKEFTIGLNRIYLLFDAVGFSTTYYVAVNKLLIEQCAEEVTSLSSTKFISWDTSGLLPFNEDVAWLRTLHYPHFSKNLSSSIWQGATVTYVAMQVAFHLGFHQVILIGVDHKYQTKGKPHSTVVSNKDDPDHFDPSYFGKGFRWQLPDLKQSELAYTMAKLAFEQNGREIVDATVGGHLRVFRKANYKDLLKSR